MSSPGDPKRPLHPDPTQPALEELWNVLTLAEAEPESGRQHDTRVLQGMSRHQPTGRVYGGQVLAQALLAAGSTTSPTRLPHSIHGYFMRAGSVEYPLHFGVDVLRDGGSFSTRRTHAYQNGEPILTSVISFQEQQRGFELTPQMPSCPGPDELTSIADYLAGIDHPAAAFLTSESPFDLRYVDQPVVLRPDPNRVPQQRVWVRSKGQADVSQLWHRAALVYACDQLILEPVMRGAGLCWMTPGLNLASLDHAMWWHRDVRIDEWLLFDLQAEFAAGGRGLGSANVFAQDGTHVASIRQEGMIRVPEQ